MIKFNDNMNTVISKLWIKNYIYAVQKIDRDLVFLSDKMGIILRLLYENEYDLKKDLAKIKL